MRQAMARMPRVSRTAAVSFEDQLRSTCTSRLRAKGNGRTTERQGRPKTKRPTRPGWGGRSAALEPLNQVAVSGQISPLDGREVHVKHTSRQLQGGEQGVLARSETSSG